MEDDSEALRARISTLLQAHRLSSIRADERARFAREQLARILALATAAESGSLENLPRIRVAAAAALAATPRK